MVLNSNSKTIELETNTLIFFVKGRLLYTYIFSSCLQGQSDTAKPHLQNQLLHTMTGNRSNVKQFATLRQRVVMQRLIFVFCQADFYISSS